MLNKRKHGAEGKQSMDKHMLGERLIRLRKKNGYSQQEVAEKINVTRQTISNWETGQGAPPLDKAAELAWLYGISLDELAGLAGLQKDLFLEQPEKDLHVLRKLEGRSCRLEFADEESAVMDAVIDGLIGNGNVQFLEAGNVWSKISYERNKDGKLFQKETVTRQIETRLLTGAAMEVEGE